MEINVQKYLSELEILVNMDSGQGNPEGITAVGKFFADRFSKLGYIVEQIDVGEKTGKCTVVKNRQADDIDVLLVGHIDTVFATGETAKRPFRKDDKRAYGLGVIDMKQGALQMLYILEALPKEVDDKLNIVAIFNPDEEIGSIYSKTLIDSYAKRSKFAFVFEASTTDGSRTVSRKGRYTAMVDFHGVAGHAGYIFDGHSISAINELIYWSNQLNKLCSKETNTSVNIGKIEGGKAHNIVADFANMDFEVRYESLNEYEKVINLIENLKAHAKDSKVGIKIYNELITPPLVPNKKTLEYQERIKKLCASNGLEYKSKGRGGLSDANHIGQYAKITLDGLGPTGDLDHSDKEYLEISSIEPSLRLAYLMLLDLPNAIKELF